MYMKKILTSLILLCFATIGLATNNYFYGIDYTQAKLFASTDKPKQIKISLIRINELLISEKENYDISKFVKTTIDGVNIEGVTLRNSEINEEAILTQSNEDIFVSEDLTKQIVKSLVISEKEGTGYLFIAKLLNNKKKLGQYDIVAFDIATRDIIYIKPAKGKAKGFGIRNFWAGSIRKMISKKLK